MKKHGTRRYTLAVGKSAPELGEGRTKLHSRLSLALRERKERHQEQKREP